MHNGELLAKEVEGLRDANAKQKQKRSRSARQIPHDTALSATGSGVDTERSKPR
jgi:hypothetical protein